MGGPKVRFFIRRSVFGGRDNQKEANVGICIRVHAQQALSGKSGHKNVCFGRIVLTAIPVILFSLV
jgi:hypothetical protein